jgi:truncated hemoglobin YjbI
MPMASLFERIGQEFIERAITEFYERAFDDVMIGHFFFGKDKATITRNQIDFTATFLGSNSHKYKGKPLRSAHTQLPIRPVHFNRRHVLMAEVIDDCGLAADLRDSWLALENQLRPLIIDPGNASCD